MPPKKLTEEPKRPMTAYFIFMQEKRESIREEDPNVGLVDLAKKMGERWKGLSDEGRKVYDVKYQEGLARYEEEMHRYQQKNARRSTIPADGGSSSGGKRSNRTKKGQSKKDLKNDNQFVFRCPHLSTVLSLCDSPPATNEAVISLQQLGPLLST